MGLRRLLVEPLGDRRLLATFPTVLSTTPALGGGTLAAGATSMQVTFSTAVNGGATTGNFGQPNQGADGILRNADDQFVALTPTYASNVSTLSFPALVGRGYHLKSRCARLREAGLLTPAELATDLGVCKTTVHAWRRDGLLHGHAYNAKEQYLFAPVQHDGPVKQQGQKRSERKPFSPVIIQRIKEVQRGA